MLLQRTWIASWALLSAEHRTIFFSLHLALFLLFMVIPWHLQNAWVFCWNWASFLPIASHRLSSWCQARFLYVMPGPSSATETAPPSLVSLGLSVPSLSISPCSFYVFKMSNTLVTLRLPNSAASMRYDLGWLWNRVLLCFQETILRRFYLNIAGLFKIIITFSAPAD